MQTAIGIGILNGDAIALKIGETEITWKADANQFAIPEKNTLVIPFQKENRLGR